MRLARPWPMCGRSYTVGPHTYIDTSPSVRTRGAGWCPWRCRTGAASGYGNPIMSTPTTGAPGVPDKPTLDGLEERWAAAWDEAGTYRFDDSATRAEVFSIDTPPADRVGLAPHGVGLRLRADRRHRPLPAHAGLEALLPDGLGRQRAADRAPGADLLRRDLRPLAPLRPGLHAARGAGQEGHPGSAGPTSSPCATS